MANFKKQRSACARSTDSAGFFRHHLKPAEKLPSTREVARRFSIHHNTVRAAYRDLARRGWLEFRKGSGVYVRALNIVAPLDKGASLDQLISIFLRIARDSGHSLSDIQSRVKSWLDLQPHDRFLVIESDRQLRKILVTEIEQATGFPTTGASLEECANMDLLMGAAPVALRGQAEHVRALLPPDTGFTVLYLRSVTDWLESGEPVPQEMLITVCSCWPDLLTNARSILVAAGVNPDHLILRDATGKGWQKNIPSESYVIKAM